jgi:hypothetical protein
MVLPHAMEDDGSFAFGVAAHFPMDAIATGDLEHSL